MSLYVVAGCSQLELSDQPGCLHEAPLASLCFDLQLESGPFIALLGGLFHLISGRHTVSSAKSKPPTDQRLRLLAASEFLLMLAANLCGPGTS